MTKSSSFDVSILLGNGDGSFQSPENYVIGGDPESVAIGDLDLAVVNSNSNKVSILFYLTVPNKEVVDADIKANDSDGPVAITISIDSGEQVGQNCDWWRVELTPAGTFNYFTLPSTSFMPGLAISYQGPLLDLASTSLLTLTNLSSGAHTYCLGVDTLINSSLDTAHLYYDYVVVTSSGLPSQEAFNGIWSGQALSSNQFDIYGDECGYADMTLNIDGEQVTGSTIDYPWNEHYTVSGSVTQEGTISLGMAHGDRGCF